MEIYAEVDRSQEDDMLRPVFALATAAVVGVVLWKLIWLFILPFVGIAVGFVVLALKILLIVGLVFLAYRLYRKLVARSTAET
jgi:uncharacterized membrane-anchored protein